MVLFYFFKMLQFSRFLCSDQGLETNGIFRNTTIQCNNSNNGSFIFNRAQTHRSRMSDLELDLESDHVVYK